MNIAIIGRSEILYNTCELLHSKGYKIPLIITSKEAPEYTKTSRDFQLFADRINAKFISTNKICLHKKDIEKASVDIGISLNYSSVISEDVISLFSYGILNAHGGDLPKYRGNACQAWAIINGETKIGLCVHRMIGGEIDSGDIISREYLDIDINTKVQHVWNWMTSKTPELFLNAINKLNLDNNFILEKQSKDFKDALRCYPRKPEDGHIDWNKSNVDILRLINSSSEPYSGAYTFIDGQKCIIWDAELYNDEEQYCAINGQISDVSHSDGYVIVITGHGKLKINEIEIDKNRCRPVTKIKSIRKRFV